MEKSNYYCFLLLFKVDKINRITLNVQDLDLCNEIFLKNRLLKIVELE